MVGFGWAPARRAHAATPPPTVVAAPATKARRLTRSRFTPRSTPLFDTLMGVSSGRDCTSAGGAGQLTGGGRFPRLIRHDHAHRHRPATAYRRRRPAHLRPVHRASRALHLRRDL